MRYLHTENDTNTAALPVLYDKKEQCCGCSACFAVCPAGAIVMLPDDEGFLYPAVDAVKCVRCRKCLSVCAFKDDQRRKGFFAKEGV